MVKKDYSTLDRNEKITYLQKLIEERKSENESMYPQITENKEERYSYFPLSETQESFFVGKLMESEEHKVGCHIYCEIEESNLDVERLNLAWNRLVLQHDMLRDKITDRGLQKIEEEVIDYKFEVYDKQCAADEELREHLEMLRGRLSHKVYQALDYPLYEICITRKNDEVFIIHFSIDEWIVDASSVAILLRQWYQLYHCKDFKLEPLSFTFRDFVIAQKKFENSRKYQEDLKYWKKKLSNINRGEMDIVRPTKANTGKLRKRYEYVLDQSRWSKMKNYAEQLNISPTALLLTIFLKVCNEYNEGKSFPLILTHFNRLPIAKDIDKVVGPFITTMIYQEESQSEENELNAELKSEEFEQKARRVQKQLWDDNDHNSISGIRILRELKKEKRVDKGYVIPIVFTSMINNVRNSHDENTGTWFDQITYNITQTPQVYLDHQIMEANGTLIFNWDVLSGYFKDGIIEEMFSRYCELLEGSCDSTQVQLLIEKNTDEDRNQEFDLTDLQGSYLYSHMVNEASDKERLLYQEFLVKEDSVERINEKWHQLVDEIDMLRVVFTKEGKQRVLEDVPVKDIPVIDLRGEEDSVKEAKLEKIREETVNQGFSMYQWPMFDIKIIRVDEGMLRVNIAFDTAIMDGQSLAILYKRLFDKEDYALKEQASFHEYIKAKKSYEESSECESKHVYWNNKFRQHLIAPFTEYYQSSKSGCNIKRISGKVDDYHILSDLAKEHNVNIESIMMTVYLEVLARRCNEKDFTVVRVGWERLLTQPSVQNTIGEFTTLGWVTRSNDEKRFWEKVHDIEKQIKTDLDHKEVCGLSGLRKAKYSKSFPVVFTGLVKGEKYILPANVTMSDGLSKTPQVYLDNISFIEKDHLLVNWDYATDIFPTDLIVEMFTEYIKELNLLCSDNNSLKQVTKNTNCIHELVEEQVKKYPGNIAIKYKNESLTYEQLDRKANQLANYLRRQGVTKDELVAICMEKSIDMIVAILAILKAGGAYVPIDPSYPRYRINYILEDSKSKIVITKVESAHKIESTTAQKVNLDTSQYVIESCSSDKPSEEAMRDSLAYIIYTSGSTGKPKGVLITHHNVVRLFERTQHWFGFNEKDVFTMYHSYAFDFSVWEIWGALLYGGTLVVVPYEVSRSFSKVYELLEQEKVTVFSQTPTAFKQLMKTEEEEGVRNLNLKYVIFGGEALNLQSLRGWFQRHGDSKPQLINMYGITETTVHVTYRPIKEADTYSSASLIGIPIPDLNLYILDENLKKVELGETGEICVSGPGLARGYLNRPDITKEKFIDNPFNPGEKLYLSGDLGRYQTNHDIEYMGRKDNQVKVRGFRIELGEIENVLLSHPQIKEAAVTIEKGEEDNKIRAFLVMEGEEISAKEIRHYVRSKLPDYMVPNIIDRIDHIPITINGKLDYKKLLNHDNDVVIENHPANSEITRDIRLSSLYRILQDELKESSLNEAEDIFDLGATSLTIVNISKRVQEELKIQIPIDVFLDKPTIGEIGDFVIGLLEKKEHENAATLLPVNKISLTREELTSIFHEELGEQEITPDADIFDLGSTSLTIVNVVKKIKEKKGIEIPLDIFLDHPTINEIIRYMPNEKTLDTREENPAIDNEPSIELPDVYCNDEDYSRQEEKYRFENKQIAAKDFSGLISLLKKEMVGIKNRYLYASAGGKNAIQTYLYIKDEAVEGIPAGVYYYHPEEHQLYFLTSGDRIIRDIYSSCYREAFDQSAFAVFFIAQLKAIEPVYLDFSKGLVTIDTGYMQELLLSNQETYQVGLCSVEEIDFSGIKDDFLLEEGHVFVNGMLGGYRTVNNYDKVSLQKYLSERNESLTSHCRFIERIIDENKMREINRQMKYNQLSKREVLELAKQKLHLRKFEDGSTKIALMDAGFDKNRYLRRSSKREYKMEKIPINKFSEFLSVLRGKNIMGTLKFMYPSLFDAYLLKVYVYVKKNAVEQLEEGLYQYDRLTHKLSLVNRDLKTVIGHCHTPFNRPHYKASAFSIFLLADLDKAGMIYGDGALKYIFTESGYMGQLLMEHQAKSNIGIVPIGGMNFDKIRENFHLNNKDMLIHSFMGGSYDYSAMKVLEDSLPQMPKVAKNDIAIIGLSARFPDAEELSEYWENLKNKKRSIIKLPLRRKELWNGNGLNEDEYYGGYIQDIELFDYELFHISLLEAKNLDPQERIMLQMVYECIEGAGYTIQDLQENANKVGVFIGSMWNDYENYGVETYRNAKEADIASLPSSIANRISYYFNFNGPSLTIQTACSSSMTALHIACESIKSGECDMAVVGGINLISHPYHLEALKSQNIIAVKGEVKLFSDQSTGLVCGEGAGVVLLTKLTKAIEQEDIIWATIKNTAIANYGKTTRYGMVSLPKQKRLIAELLEKAGISLETIQYVEASATGLSIADMTEVQALSELFSESGISEKSCLIGSVKANIGHLESASFLSQLCKVVLQMQQEEIAPTILDTEINPLIHLENTPFQFADRLQKWSEIRNDISNPYRALINSFGASGSIGSTILEQYKSVVNDRKESQSETAILFSAASMDQLNEYIKKVANYLNKFPLIDIRDIAYTLSHRNNAYSDRIVFLCRNTEELIHLALNYLTGDCSDRRIIVKDTYVPLTNGDLTNLGSDAFNWINRSDETRILVWIKKAYKVYLPVRPFKRLICWNSMMNVANSKKDENTSNELLKAADGTKSELDGLVAYLIEVYSNISEIPVSKINSRVPLENYGLSSIIISKFNKVLERELSIKSSTLLFEVQTLQELAELLLTDYFDEIMSSKNGEMLKSDCVMSFKSDSVTTKCITKIQEQMIEEQVAAEQNSRDIAIIGLSGIYPDADDLEELWENLKQGKDSITEIPIERWDHKAYFDNDHKKNIYAKWGGFLRNMDGFDPLFFQISPKEAVLMDPQERKFLEVAYQTLEDAGYTKKSIQEKYQGKVGVYVGAMFHDYQMFSGKSAIEESYIATGAVGASISNRISYILDLHGPSMTVNTMCSSVLTCLNLAVQSIHSGECKTAIVGGVNLIVHPNKYILHCQNRMLSTDGRCRAFGKDGDGFVPSEGVGAMLIKPLSEAINDKDHIYGIIKGIKINHDGKKNGYMVPSPVQQGNLIKSVLQENNILPETISYIEAHGTGTKLGDPIEIAGLSQAYKDKASKKNLCPIGSIKSNIGHCESAAGIASITKVLLQMKHKMLVPSIHCDELNPNIDFDHSPFYVQRKLESWEVGQEQQPRRASVSSFGAGGVNGYLVLEEYVRCEQFSKNDDSKQLLVMSAHNAKELKEIVKRILHFLTQIVNDKNPEIKEIKEIISETLHIDSCNIDITEKLLDLGLSKDQLDLIIAQIESNYKVKMENDIIVQNETIEELIENIKGKLDAQHETPMNEYQEYTLKNIAHTLLHGREHMEERIAVIAATTKELVEILNEYLINPSTDKVLAGNTENECRVKEEYEDFLEQFTKHCLTDDTMKDFARFYVNGAAIDWKSVTDSNDAYKVSLPTYPFAEKKYWVPVNIERTEGTINSDLKVAVPTEEKTLMKLDTVKEESKMADKYEYIRNQISDQELEQSISTVIKNILGHILELDEQEINLNYDLQKYGVDSIMLSDLSEHINQVYGIHTTAAMLLSFHTIKDLIKGLHKKYYKEISCYEVRSGKAADILQEMADETEAAVTVVSVTEDKVHEDQDMEDQDLEDNVTEPIAVVGIAGMAPGAENIFLYWENLLNNQCSITACIEDRKELCEYLRANSDYEDVMYGGYLNDIDKWEPLFFGISPNEAKRMDPQQRLFLEVAQRALEDAGYSRKRVSGTKTGVFVGASNDDYSKIAADLSIMDAHSAIGAARSLIANRVSYYFDLNGPSEVIDTACSSTGVAINRAIKALRSKECNMSIVGGVNLILTPNQFISYDDAGMLTKNRKVSVFSEESNGYLRGEGIGCVILKPLSKAIKDNDRIHALILGSAVNHGGKAMSITTPNYEAQMEVIKEACRDGSVSEKTITYIEAQGSCNKIGDSIEWQALEEAYGETLDGRKRGAGTIKANVGHLESASGIFALIKIIFAMKHRIIPAMIHCDRISDDIYCNHNTLIRENMEWNVLLDKEGDPLPRRAGINAFGIGGVNAHFIVEEYVNEETKMTVEEEDSLIALSANSKEALKEYIKRVKIYASQNKNTKLNNFAYTLQIVREAMPYRITFVADNWETLIQKCNQALEEKVSIQNCSMDTTNSLLEQILEPSGIDMIVKEAFRAKNHRKIGMLWSRGVDINWMLLYEGKSLQITNIPEYPFEKESFWISDLTVKKSLDVETEESKDQITNMLRMEVAKISGTDSSKLADHVALIQYGFDSIMFTKLKYYIETQFMINLGSNEILYRNTIGEIAAMIRKKTSEVYEDAIELQNYQGEDLNDLFEKLSR